VRPAVVLAALAVVALGAAGCGGSGASEAAFRTKVDSACRYVARHAKRVHGDSRRSVDQGIVLLEAMADRLGRLRPPAHDKATYRDLVARLHDAAAYTKAHEAQLYGLDHTLESKLKSEVRYFQANGKAPRHATFQRLFSRIRTLERRPVKDLRRAGRDARTLRLSACKVSSSGRSSQVSGTSGPPVTSPVKRAYDRKMLAVNERCGTKLRATNSPPSTSIHSRQFIRYWVALMRRDQQVYLEEAAALARITPPQDAGAQHRSIVDAYRAAARASAAMAVWIRHGQHGIPAGPRSNWQARIDRAVHELDAKGYALENFGAAIALGTITTSSG
jgi:hypothetical protein